ncbi:hypothetical protein PHYSODRAFT_335988 [Phytophthora sojae]|uniref:Uncharacterized protein n=1 Tax=Phytophthora sojae (strain P6497) TaxID=1094619 RepID=G4ZS52_PHYSP|nr:hypothetical protein PHYSODRAFT_335988 [Phytophthora sojae]EGZ14348.1 hypothetical protein PHYSODRAFT_335988 [Phytophthora sojae]|eukprot:XP_009531777.1 hypothetical protein PHYSODRAFT_335988 [Phytophthora sojae]
MTRDSTSASSSKAHADPATEASDRDARVNDDASRKKQLQVGESQRMSRG